MILHNLKKAVPLGLLDMQTAYTAGVAVAAMQLCALTDDQIKEMFDLETYSSKYLAVFTCLAQGETLQIPQGATSAFAVVFNTAVQMLDPAMKLLINIATFSTKNTTNRLKELKDFRVIIEHGITQRSLQEEDVWLNVCTFIDKNKGPFYISESKMKKGKNSIYPIPRRRMDSGLTALDIVASIKDLEQLDDLATVGLKTYKKSEDC